VLRYLIRRVLVFAPSLVLVSMLTFVMVRMAGGDPAALKLGLHATPESLHHLRGEMGLLDPWPVQYWKWLLGALHGDLGRSYLTGSSVTYEILSRKGETLHISNPTRIPDAGEIEIELREVSGGVEIRVCDNGRGIPEPVQGKLFEPFVSYGKENGTGLGLTVVQKIIQDHGGDVIVEKTSAEGTVFRITLPIIASSSSDSGGEGTPHVPPLARAKKVQSE